MKLYHTNEHRGNILEIPVFAEGNTQWLGGGYYFWQDYEFAEEWGENRICKKQDYKDGLKDKYDIYQAEVNINFPSDETIDTVFDENDYRKFLEKVEYFALEYEKQFNEKPTLEEFNEFIQDLNIWKGIVAIRFQDLPANSNRTYLKVKRFYYKKRIQIVLYDIDKIRKFEVLGSFDCPKN